MSTPSARSGALARRDGVLTQEAHGETVLLRLADGYYYTLDEVGAAVWELCDGSRTADEVIAAIGDTFDAPEDVIRQDVTAFVGELVDEQLLDRAA